MALGSDLKKQAAPEELDELLEGLEKLLERTKVLYEQYFMGIQKVAPLQLHRDIERRVRELTQQQIRNTSLRFRFTTLSQKFGAYQTYWKRTLREIEQGKYVRDLARVKRKADAQGEELPEELLAKLPKLVQDRIRRDRAKLAERALREAEEAEQRGAGPGTSEPAPQARVSAHEITEEEAEALFSEADLDMDGLFGALTGTPETTNDAPTSPIAAAVTSEPAPVSTAKPAPGPAPAKVGPRSVTVPLPTGLGSSRPRGQTDPGFRVPPPPGGGRAESAPPAGEQPSGRAEPAERVGAGARPASSTPAAAIAPPPGMNDRQCRELYTRYVKARQLVGETTDDVTYEKLVSSLNKQASAIMTQHGARGVEFHVIVRGDKVVLKAKPLKPGK